MTFINAFRALALDKGAQLVFPEITGAQWLRWKTFVIIEVTRNAIRHLNGTSECQIHWDIGDAGETMKCVSSPHAVDASVWPFSGIADPDSMKGTHLIARLARRRGYIVRWTAVPLKAKSKYCEVTFELQPKKALS